VIGMAMKKLILHGGIAQYHHIIFTIVKHKNVTV
jgi:hypothetical protein